MKRVICGALVFLCFCSLPSGRADIVEDRAALLEAYPELEIYDEDEAPPAWSEQDGQDGENLFLPASAPAAPVIAVPAALLMEKETGTVLYALNERDPRPPASVTKVMTLLLIMEAMDNGVITDKDLVPVSAYAMRMGGSQVYMHEGETYTVRDMLKSIVIASGNDASVAMAEFLAGSEESFVARMNERAAELGMTDTKFINCSGLPEEGHVTSARDIALMSRELIGKHPGIRPYATTWMDSLRDGAFTLANTNKLVRFYPGATGLKTGSTGIAKYCLSATAERDGMELIAVILGADSSDIRFENARKLLDFGFANFQLVPAYPDQVPLPVPVTLGAAPEVSPEVSDMGRILVEKLQAKKIERRLSMAESVEAPVEKGQKLGEVEVVCGDEVLAVVPIVAADAVPRLGLWDIFGMMLRLLFMK